MRVKHWAVSLFMAAASVDAIAVGSALHTMTDGALLQRWHAAAKEYGRPEYYISDCKNARAFMRGLTIYTCETMDAKGTLSFERADGQLVRVLFESSRNMHTNSSMFIRFVQASDGWGVGDMTAKLIAKARSAGKACLQEEAAKVCAIHDGGEYQFEALRR
jgi:hypothetical protein